MEFFWFLKMSSSVRHIFLSRNSSLCPVSFSSNQSILESCVTCDMVVPYTRSTGKSIIEKIRWDYAGLQGVLQSAIHSQLSNSMEQSLFEKLIFSHRVKKFSTFCGNQKLITRFTSAHQLALSGAR
jgi:hypothetical protein